MKKLLIGASIAAAAFLVIAAPASAQIYLGAESGGGGVQAGPYNTSPAYNWGNAYGAYDYSGYPYSGYSSYPTGPYGSSTGNAYGDPYWNSLTRPGGYANGAMGGYNNSSSSGYGIYAYGGYGYPGGYGAYGYADPYAAGNAFASAPDTNCRRIRERVTRNGRTITRTRTTCD